MGQPHIHWLRFPFFRLASIRRCRLSRKSLIVASICAIYLCFVVFQVGYPQLYSGRRTAKGKLGLNDLEDNGALPADVQTGARFVFPTRSNVVYITLKSKRRKPAHIRGTIRPKVRTKTRRSKVENGTFTHDKGGRLKRNTGQSKQHFTHWIKTNDIDYKSLEIIPESHKDGPEISAIRVYGHRAPPWFSALDMDTMRFLANAKVLRMRKISRSDSSLLLVFEGESNAHSAVHKGSKWNNVCSGQCGVIRSPVDHAEVFAYHLDRVLGLNRTLPAVSRTFSYLHDGQSCPVVLWDASLYPDGFAAGWSTVSLSWREYQSSLKLKCWHKSSSTKPDAGCSTIHHYEWSKLALFDFLLQIHQRLDQSCCGFRPRQEDVCVQMGYHAECAKQGDIQLANIVHRGQDQRHLVFVNNEGFFDRNEDNLDFRLLEGIKEFPEVAVSVLRNQKLREKLLQSLFLDQTYWESQGGRQGIDKLIDVIERRAKVLLTYINAHGIKVISMKT